MDSSEWNARIRLIDRGFRRVLGVSIGCGPFDGGCLIVAQALQSVIGGEIAVLVDADDYALHAVVSKDGRLWDYDGPMEPRPFLDRYNGLVKETRYLCVRQREFRGYDLTEAMEDDKLARRLASLFQYALPPSEKSGSARVLVIQRPDLENIVAEDDASLFRDPFRIPLPRL